MHFQGSGAEGLELRAIKFFCVFMVVGLSMLMVQGLMV